MSEISNDDLGHLSREFNLGEVIRLKRMGGFSAENFEINAEAGRFVLKRYPRRIINQIKRVAQLGDWAVAKGLPTSPPRHNNEGAFVALLESSGCCAVLNAFVDGNVLHSEGLGQGEIRSVAGAAATFQKIMGSAPFNFLNQRRKLNRSMAVYVDRHEKILSSTTYLPRLARYRDTFRELLDVKRELLSISASRLAYNETNGNVVVHGDFHNENILFASGKAEWILDLEEMRLGWVGEDVITFAIFACGQAAISDSVLERMRPMIEEFIKVLKVTHKEMVASIDATIIRLSISTRIEEWALVDETGLALRLIMRDVERFRSLRSNAKDIYEAWA